ncbi:hypothetical protein ACLUX0_00385 [Limosilactobacillus mucosae]
MIRNGKGQRPTRAQVREQQLYDLIKGSWETEEQTEARSDERHIVSDFIMSLVVILILLAAGWIAAVFLRGLSL